MAAPSRRRLHLVMHDFQPGWDTYVERRGYGLEADLAFEQVRAEDYEAILLLGGRAPEYLRNNESLLDILRAFDRAEKWIFAICHGVQVLAAAGLASRQTSDLLPSRTARSRTRRRQIHRPARRARRTRSDGPNLAVAPLLLSRNLHTSCAPVPDAARSGSRRIPGSAKTSAPAQRVGYRRNTRASSSGGRPRRHRRLRSPAWKTSCWPAICAPASTGPSPIPRCPCWSTSTAGASSAAIWRVTIPSAVCWPWPPTAASSPWTTASPRNTAFRPLPKMPAWPFSGRWGRELR